MSEPDSVKECCAAMQFADVVADIMKRRGLSLEQARSSFIASPAYDLLYDFSSGLWGAGPDYLYDFYESTSVL